MPRAEVRPGRGGLIRALLLSVAAAAVPVAGTFLFPDNLRDYEALTWLLLLVPGFLWAYERGWRGVATALAAGMATVSITYALAEVGGRQVPDLLLPVIVIYIGVSLGIGVFGERVGAGVFDAAAERLALQDPLTGLPNRRHAELQVAVQFEAAERGQHLAVVLFDLDCFADYNRRHGRTPGDGVLRTFAALLRQQTRRLDLAARYGADEFVSVLAGCSEEGALVFAARLQETLRSADPLATLPTVSAGVACYRGDMRSARDLLQAAEQALVLAKRDGRDRVRVHGHASPQWSAAGDPGMQRAAAEGQLEGASNALHAVQQEFASGDLSRFGEGRSAFLLSADALRRSELDSFLRAHGFIVTAGVELADTMVPLNRDFDLIFTDTQQPGSPAAELIRQLRQQSPTTRIIGIPRRTGEGAGVQADALRVRVDAHYVGLSDPAAVRGQLAELLAERDALREAEVRHRVLADELRAVSRQAKLALAASEAKYRQVVQTVQEVVFSIDVDGRWTSLNPAWTTITGFGTEETLGASLFQYVHADDEPGLRAHFLDALSRRAGQLRHECRWKTRTGAHRWAELRLEFATAPDGAVDGCTGVIGDVTERRRAEDALRRSEEYFRSLIENSGDMIAVLNADATFRYLSPAVERVFGYSAEELVGADPMRLVHADDQEQTRAGLALVLDDPGVMRTAELRVRNRGGEWRHVELTCRNLLLTPGVDGIVMNARDVTERHRAEQALRENEQLLLEAEKMEAVGRLAGGVAHDFNNLLTTIRGHVDLLIADLDDDAAIRPELTQVRQAAERATSLTRQLLAFSRRQVLQPRVLELNPVVAGMETALRRITGSDVELTMTLPQGAGWVRADRAQLEQVLQNLVLNAREALPAGGTIHVATERCEFDAAAATRAGVTAGSYSVLRVRDNGRGMTPEIVASAFEPFFTTKPTRSGTGLGLSTVYGIVKQSGGHVSLRSEPGAGTEVVVVLPEAAPEAGLPAAASAPPHAVADAQPEQETILVVEDETPVRELTQRILERGGYRVLAAPGAIEALALIAAAKPRIDLLLTDVVMPGIGGRELAAAVRKLMPAMPVLFMSGYTEDAILHDGAMLDGASFIEKPFTPGGLVEKVRQCILRDEARALHGQ